MIDEPILHYLVVGKLGDGGMGVVCKAQDNVLAALWGSNSCLTTSRAIHTCASLVTRFSDRTRRPRPRGDARSGKMEAARTEYQNSLARGRDADPDSPILRQPKTEYAKLT